MSPRSSSLPLAASVLFSALACSGGPAGTGADASSSGGTQGASGGATSSGGTSAGTGGATASGGSSATGGKIGSGGTTDGSGGTTASGGSPSTGGTTASGGSSATGGVSNAGGTHETGGASATGGGGGSAIAGAPGGKAGTAGKTGAAGTTGAAGSDGGGPYMDLTFSGLTSAVELAPLRLAANGIYPAKVTISSGGVDNLFSSGGSLLASNAETQAIRSSAQHSNLRIIFTICEGLYRIVAKKSAGIKTLSDLKGKSVTAPNSGASSDYYLYKMLGTVNLTTSDVKITGGTPGMGALATDAATIWEPGIQYVANNLGSDAIEFQFDAEGKEVYRELFNLHASAETLADAKKRRSIVKFVKSLITASEQIRNDPTIVFPLMTGPTGEGTDNLAKSFKYERYAGVLVPDLLDVMEQEEVWRAKYDNRTARTRAQLAPLIDDTVYKDAMALP